MQTSWPGREASTWRCEGVGRAFWSWRRVRIGMPLCRALGGGLFELRVSLTSRRIARVVVCVREDELYALHAFIKKTRKTPDSDLKLARRRKRELERAR
jgi:phage-related protein